MTEREKQLFTNVLSKVFALDGEQINSFFNEEGELTDITAVLDADTKRIQKFSNDAKSQYNKGKAEALAALETTLREKYPVENSDLKGVDLVEEIITSKVSEASKLPDDAFEKHPKYATMKRAHEKEVQQVKSEMQAAIEAKEREFTKKETFARVRDKVLTQFESLRPLLPEDPQKAANQKKWFLREFEANDYQFDDKGEILILDNEGKPKTDEHGHLLKFDELVKNHAASYFDFQTAEHRTSGGGNPKPGQGKPEGRKYKITDKATFEAELKLAKTPDERVAILNEGRALNLI